MKTVKLKFRKLINKSLYKVEYKPKLYYPSQTPAYQFRVDLKYVNIFIKPFTFSNPLAVKYTSIRDYLSTIKTYTKTRNPQ